MSSDCESVSLECPVDQSIYGYYPSLQANAFFAAFFGVCLVAQLVMGIRWKTWTFMIAMGFGCLCEVIGVIQENPNRHEYTTNLDQVILVESYYIAIRTQIMVSKCRSVASFSVQ